MKRCHIPCLLVEASTVESTLISNHRYLPRKTFMSSDSDRASKIHCSVARASMLRPTMRLWTLLICGLPSQSAAARGFNFNIGGGSRDSKSPRLERHRALFEVRNDSY